MGWVESVFWLCEELGAIISVVRGLKWFAVDGLKVWACDGGNWVIVVVVTMRGFGSCLVAVVGEEVLVDSLKEKEDSSKIT